MERLVPSGEASARTFYGDEADGWVLHMMTNVWNYTATGRTSFMGSDQYRRRMALRTSVGALSVYGQQTIPCRYLSPIKRSFGVLLLYHGT